MGRRTRAIIALTLAAAFWAGNFVFGKVAVTSIPPFSLVFLRWAFALVPLFVIAQLVERPDWRSLARHWRFLLLQSVLGLAGYNFLLYAALSVTTPFAASLINAANPALIALAVLIVLREKIGWRSGAGILLAFIGVAVVLTKGDLAALLSTRFGAGDLLMLGAIVSWTAYTIAARRGPRLPPVAQVAVQALFLVLGLGIPAPFVGITLPHTSAAIASLAFIVIFPSCLSYVLWNRALEVIPPARAGVFLNLITAFTAIWALATGTPVTPAEIIGGIVILLGVLLTVDFPKRRRAATSPQVQQDQRRVRSSPHVVADRQRDER